MALLPAFSVFIFVGFVLLRTMHTSMGDGDSGEFAFRSVALGVAHPPGYPLLVTLTHMFHEMVQAVFGNSHTSFKEQNLTCVIYSALGATLIFLICYQQLRCSLLSSLCGVFSFAFSRGVWTYSHQLEVFPLHNLMMAALLYTFCIFRNQRCSSSLETGCPSVPLLLGAFISGLSLSNQHTSILFVIPVIASVYWMEPKALTRPSLLLPSAACFFLGLVPYALLPLRALADRAATGTGYNLLSWGLHDSFDSFVGHLLRREFGTFSLSVYGQSVSRANIWGNWLAYKNAVVQDITPLGVGLIAVGLLMCIWEALMARLYSNTSSTPQLRGTKEAGYRQELFWVALWLFYMTFMNTLSNLNTDDAIQLGILERFWQQPLIPLSILLSISVQRVTQLSILLNRGANFRVVVRCALLSFFCFSSLVSNYEECNHSDNDVVEMYGYMMMASVPPNSLLLLNGDMLYFSTQALQTVHGLRPDVCIVSQTLMPAEWYVSALRETKRGSDCIVIPAGRRSLFPDPKNSTTFTYKALFDVNLKQSKSWKAGGAGNRRVFVGGLIIPGDESYSGHYGFAPYGLLQEVLPERDFDAVAQLAEEERPRKSHDFWTPDRYNKYGSFVSELMHSLPLSLPRSATNHRHEHRRLVYGRSTWERAALENIAARYVVMGEQLLIFSYVDDTTEPDDGIETIKDPAVTHLLRDGSSGGLDQLAELALSRTPSADQEGKWPNALPERLKMLLVGRRFLNTALYLQQSILQPVRPSSGSSGDDDHLQGSSDEDIAGRLNTLQLRIAVLQNLARFFMYDDGSMGGSERAATTKAEPSSLLRRNRFGQQVLKELIESLEEGERIVLRSASRLLKDPVERGGGNPEASEDIRETLVEVQQQLKYYRSL